MLSQFTSYSSGVFVASSSSANVQFSLQARYVLIENFAAGDVWVRFAGINPGSTGIATTDHTIIGTCADHRIKAFTFLPGMTPVALSLMATSTAAGRGHVGITAFGQE